MPYSISDRVAGASLLDDVGLLNAMFVAADVDLEQLRMQLASFSSLRPNRLYYLRRAQEGSDRGGVIPIHLQELADARTRAIEPDPARFRSPPQAYACRHLPRTPPTTLGPYLDSSGLRNPWTLNHRDHLDCLPPKAAPHLIPSSACGCDGRLDDTLSPKIAIQNYRGGIFLQPVVLASEY